MWKTRFFLFLTGVFLFHQIVKGLWTVGGIGVGVQVFHSRCGKEKLNVENSVQKVDNSSRLPAAGEKGRGGAAEFSTDSSLRVEKPPFSGAFPVRL